MPRLFVLDAMGLAYRAHYAFISRPLVNSRGETTSAIFGFANTVLKIRREERPDFWALAWDGPGPTFRHERFPDYKATRKPMPPELLAQIPAIEDVARALGLPVLEVPGTEADDVMATLAQRGEHDGMEVALVTSDKDLLQLVDDHVRLYSPQGRGEDYAWVDAEGVRAKWGVPPGHMRDVLALMGDSSDNVPGVPGVGEKTARELITRFGSLDEVYRRLDEVARPALRAKLEAHREQAFLSRDLVTVRTDLELPHGWDQLRCAPVRRGDLLALAQHHELARLERVAREIGVSDEEAGRPAPGRAAERRGTASETPAPGVKLAVPEPADAGGRQGTLDLWAEPDAEHPAPGLEAIEARLHEVRARSIHGLALLPVADEGDVRRGTLVGLAVAARDGTACYLPLAHEHGPRVPIERVREWLAPAISDPGCPKVAHEWKRLAHLLSGVGLDPDGLACDLHLASFVLDPARGHELPALARDLLAVALPSLEPRARRGRARPSLAAAGVGPVSAAAEAQVAALHPLAEALRAQLEAREQWELLVRLEQPLVPVLLEMERTGVALDRPVLERMAADAGEEIARLERTLAELAGEDVNLNSGPQLARLLFEKFGLKPGRRTKTGFSTDQAVLEELAGEHPFPRGLLEYRALSKLKSTYLDALPQQADPRDGRVHTTFHQTVAATGRLSSSDPNLQNIPMRTPQGRAIRRAFVAPPGRVLVGADYSQIELRVMAHLSQDPGLIEAFAAGEDVHANTARRIFNVQGELDPALRARAKVVNFGVLYGMGARSLSQQMGIGLSEAQDFIQGYFRVYARVREYLDHVIEEARVRGWVETLLGRRRFVPGLRSPHGGERALAERVAINTPIQGSAADLMKLAMIRVHRALRGVSPSARQLLQVHDELLLECPERDAGAVGACVKREMERCFALRVPLVVSVGRGPTWFDVH